MSTSTATAIEKGIDAAINHLVQLLSGRVTLENKDTAVPSTGLCGVPGMQSYLIALRDLSGITHEYPYPAEVVLKFMVEGQTVKTPKKKKGPTEWVVMSQEEVRLPHSKLADAVFYLHVPRDCFKNITRLTVTLSSSTGIFAPGCICAPLQEVFNPNMVSANPYHHLVLDFNQQFVAQLFFIDATNMALTERNRLEILLSGQKFGFKSMYSPVVGNQPHLISHQQMAMRQWLQDTEDIVTLVNGVTENFPSLQGAAAGDGRGKSSGSSAGLPPAYFNGVFQTSVYWRKNKSAKEPSELVSAPLHRLRSGDPATG